MIIKGERVRASRAVGPLANHLLRGEENDAVTLVQGTEDDIYAAFGDARALGRTYSLRHFIVSPAEEMSRDDAIMVVGLLANEFGFNAESAIVVEHAKPRAVVDAFQTHWHCLVPEQDSATGQTLSSQFSYLRNEKCARIAEYRLRHKFVIGPHAFSILSALEKDGLTDIAAALKAALANASSDRPREGFSTDIHQMGKRRGLDVPKARAHVRAAWETTTTREEFEAALASQQLRLRVGDKADTYIAESIDGIFVGAAHRLARASREEFLHRMKGQHDARSKIAPEDATGVFRTPSHGDQQRQSTPGQARSHAELQYGRPAVDDIGIDPQRAPRTTVQQRGATPAHRRNCAIRAGGRARRLREALNAQPTRTGALVREAQFLASSPVDRVAAQLYRYESQLDTQLKELLAAPPASDALIENRRLAEKLTIQSAEHRASIDAAQQKLEGIMADEPHGLRARLDGRYQRWQARVTEVNAEYDRLKQQRESLGEHLNLFKSAIATSEAAAVARHQQHLRSALVVDRRTRLKADIERVQRARKALAVSPFLAWGGVAMVMAVVGGISEAVQVLEGEFGRGPYPRFFVTDIWGIGLPSS